MTNGDQESLISQDSYFRGMCVKEREKDRDRQKGRDQRSKNQVLWGVPIGKQASPNFS